MLKSVLEREGPYELDINKIFSKEPLASDPRNHCAPLLDVIELPNDPPIMVHAFLRPFYKPRFQTYGEFVAFFGQISEVGITSFTLGSIVWLSHTRASNLCIRTTSRIGNFPSLDLIWAVDPSYQGLHLGEHHARPIKNVSKLVPSL